MAEAPRRKIKLIVIIVALILIAAFAIWYIHSTADRYGVNPGGPVRGLNVTSAYLEGYDFVFSNGSRIIISSPNMSMNIAIHPFIARDGSDFTDTVVYAELSVINNSVQKSVVLKDVCSNGSMTYIFSPEGNTVEIAYVISYVDGMYILFNFSLGMAHYIQAGGFSYHYNLTSPYYGNYTIVPVFWPPQVSYYSDQNIPGVISFNQLPLNDICYEEISITPGGDYLEFMTGPYNAQPNSYYSYNAFSLEVE
ncbi:hypothetical protein [Thermoplasma acidophilum]|uniref:Uncharacterized protein n=1 Tax=Thermoplasma acidophilum (strain ATCC 25905 / DSM 1728 / JCM 9062 / NBRC 15155 / AMRC-C165) TaxID=273075 RepID=Q9HK80_THEAC|nr:hypothetical protein [Thermoplasma acidophilum]MCY0852303.1 hypothetical protein [Thermoplasma acidophilum]CAC11859.1 hypothetical protein [Thermoplasma acidophilum]